jgi:hypothetical protein
MITSTGRPGQYGIEDVVTFVNRHQLPVRRRSSVWSALLDPFLDTWEEQQVIDRQFEWFARLGLDRDTVTRWWRSGRVWTAAPSPTFTRAP